MELNNCTFSGSISRNISLIEIQSNNFSVKNSNFSENKCEFCYGSVFNIKESKFVINNSTFKGN